LVTKKLFFGPLESKLLFTFEMGEISVFSFEDAKKTMNISSDSFLQKPALKGTGRSTPTPL